MRNIRKWDKNSAAQVKSIFGLRKKYTWQKSPKKRKKLVKDRHVEKYCSWEGCYFRSKRIDLHLRRAHKLKPGENRYKYALFEAKFKKYNSATEIINNNNNEDSNEEEASNLQEEPQLFSTLDVEKSAVEDENSSKEFSASFATLNDEIRESDSQITEIDSLCKRYIQYLVSVDGGLREANSAKQSACEVLRIAKCIPHCTLKRLCNPMDLRKHFLDKHCLEKKYKADTIKHFLRSLGDFYNFLITEEVGTDEDIPNEDIPNQYIKMKSKCVYWSKGYNKASKERLWERSMEDYESLLTPEQVSVYRCSDVVRKSTNFFCQINEDREFQLTSQSYCYMRDHLFVEIVLSNASRSGALANMMVEEFKKATVEDDGITVIAVKKHKTSATYGHTRICLKPMIFGYLKVFVEKVRPKLKTSIQNVFVSFTGQKMQPGAISKQIHERFKEAKTLGDSKRPPKIISCSRIRKSHNWYEGSRVWK